MPGTNSTSTNRRRAICIVLLVAVSVFIGSWFTTPQHRHSLGEIFTNGANFAFFLLAVAIIAIFGILIGKHRESRLLQFLTILVTIGATVLVMTNYQHFVHGFAVLVPPLVALAILAGLFIGAYSNGSIRGRRNRSTSTTAPATPAGSASSSTTTSIPVASVSDNNRR
jgi:peptidoglycan/LPS O-acetylase OafA/YrhL